MLENHLRDLNYPVLSTYIQICRARGLDCSYIIPTAQIIDELVKSLEIGGKTMNDVVSYVESVLGDKLACDLSIEAFKQTYGVSIDCVDAKRHLIMEIAHWYIEILSLLGYVRVRELWKP